MDITTLLNNAVSGPVEPVIRVLLRATQQTADNPFRDPAVQTLTHALILTERAKQAGVDAVVEFDKPMYDVQKRRLYIPVPIGPDAYVALLHEFGHVFGPMQDNYTSMCYSLQLSGETTISSLHPRWREFNAALIETELGAWEWALDNAVVWTEDMSNSAVMALSSYLRKECIGNAAVRPEYWAMLERLARKGL